MARAGTRAMKSSTSEAVTMVAVGLFGLAMKTILVMGVMARAIASRSSRWSLSVTTTTLTTAAPPLHDQGVDDEGGMGDHRLVAGTHEGPREQLDQLVGAAAEDDVIGGDPVATGQCLGEVVAGAVRIAIELVQRVGHRPLHLLGRRQRVLVGRELDWGGGA